MIDVNIEISDWSPCVSPSQQKGCGACCIAPSITSPIPGMPDGKRAGERCVQLNDHNLCKLFGMPSRPKVCLDFTDEESICGSGPGFALKTLNELELMTL